MSLASTHWMPVAPRLSEFDDHTCLQTLPNVPSAGRRADENIAPFENHCFRELRLRSVVLKPLHWNLGNANRRASARVGMCLPKVHMLKPNPLGVRRWGLWEAIRS